MCDAKYMTLNYPCETGGKTLLTGIREVRDQKKKVLISGFYENSTKFGFIYKGDVFGNGKWYSFVFPSPSGSTVSGTFLYGPNNGCKKDQIEVVGNYTLEGSTTQIGCLYQGHLNGCGVWTTLIPTSSEPVLNTIAHSTMGGMVVGNYETSLFRGKAFIYDICRRVYYNIVKPGALSVTAYGIWHNCGCSYTICGGFSNLVDTGLDQAYLVDWNSSTGVFLNWRNYAYDNDPAKAILTHFDGITKCGDGYNLTGDWLETGTTTPKAFFCKVDEKNGAPRTTWCTLSYPYSDATSGNSVYKNYVIGVYDKDSTVNGYISRIGC